MARETPDRSEEYCGNRSLFACESSNLNHRWCLSSRMPQSASRFAFIPSLLAAFFSSRALAFVPTSGAPRDEIEMTSFEDATPSEAVDACKTSDSLRR